MAPGYFRIDFFMIFHVFWEQFWHRFLNFFTNGENHEFIAQGIVLEGFYIQKKPCSIICSSFFHVLSGTPFGNHLSHPKRESMAVQK